MRNKMIDREKFFAAMRSWGSLKQSQVDGLNSLLDGFEADEEMTDMRWRAYALATTKHETANTYKPIAEYGKGRGKPYGKKDPETGQVYYGRGFVQLTHRFNYEKLGDLLGVDLVNQPDFAMDPEIAYQILSIGMRDGLFTGKKLADYINGKKADYLNARKIINAMDKAALIAGYAKRFETILTESTTDKPILNGEVTEPQQPEVVTTTTTTTETPDVKKVVEEKAVIPAQVKEIAGTGLSTIGNKLVTGGVSTGLLASIGAFLEKAWPMLIFAGVLIVLGIAVWMLIYHHQHKEKQIEAQIVSDPTRTDIKFK